MTPEGKEPRQSVLIVDDDSIIRALLHTALQRHFDVLCMPNGREVPGLVAHHKPDLVILDINVPGTDSYALCSGVRQQARQQHTPILFMTVCHDNEVFFSILKSEGNSYIKKPFELPKLLSLVRGLLAPLPSASGPGLDAPDQRG
ncbi:MAG: response regulator [Elusimicrobia bacterium]|nr:response regulator [Elusimicrobiota bacterium]